MESVEVGEVLAPWWCYWASGVLWHWVVGYQPIMSQSMTLREEMLGGELVFISFMGV